MWKIGEPAYACAAGTVVSAVDEFPDQPPHNPTAVAIGNASGNLVVLDLGEGVSKEKIVHAKSTVIESIV